MIRFHLLRRLSIIIHHLAIAELLINCDLILVKHGAELVVIRDCLLKLSLHHIKMVLKLLEGLKHRTRIDLELRDLHVLLLDGRVRDGAQEAEVLLDPVEVLLGGDPRQIRQLPLDIRGLRSDENGELFRLDEVRTPGHLSNE